MIARIGWGLAGVPALYIIVQIGSACGLPVSAEVRDIETRVNAYYDAVIRDDAMTQMSFWTDSGQDEARSQAEIWAKRSKEELKVKSIHVEGTEEPALKIVHYYITVKDRKTPEGKAGLMEKTVEGWKFKELQ